METLRARHWKLTQEHKASDLYLDITGMFRDFILKQPSLEVTNCICLGLGSLSGKDMYDSDDQSGQSLSQLVAFEGMIDLLSELLFIEQSMPGRHWESRCNSEPKFIPCLRSQEPLDDFIGIQ